MAYEKKDMSGALFKNDRKTRETHPEYQGYVLVNGVEFWLSAWVKEGGKGKFFSLSLQPKNKEQDSPLAVTGAASNTRRTASPANAPLRSEMDDEIPF